MPTYFKSPDFTVKLVCAGCYLTFGIAGIIYTIAGGRFKDAPFFRFHFLQSIIIGLLQTLLIWGGGAMISIMVGILGLFGSALGGISTLFAGGADLVFKLMGFVFSICSLLGIIQSLRGKQLEIPFVSRLVRQNMR
ncbi:MAG TPA: hypothetical protein PKH78_14770 [Candidatus Obscuribacter sp.]|nr:hypothetical protein [Candidatus Obscuribacter sp.]MBK9276722.1 hypothetical protein [Candidatus Obscuribacter sp.]MBL8083533.1 hypothetical protein [Candidatus Obscuribacter sp.]HND07039.1 hypothetical protein [Candidatus Obscuribacter sp.]HNN64313.1 hypothetical protein [Candidatus Obscuribacter sp.]